jgi:hypothetical protein
MSNCSGCRFWLTARVTDYEDGTRIFNVKCEEGKGQCESLNIETEAGFYCNRFAKGNEHIEVMAKKTGSPWHHSHWITCPDCKGTGITGVDSSCERCQRTGRCLLYDDGYVGEEKTRRHPNEAAIGPPPKPTCISCNHEIEASWKACPFCGQRTPVEGEIERVSELL